MTKTTHKISHDHVQNNLMHIQHTHKVSIIFTHGNKTPEEKTLSPDKKHFLFMLYLSSNTLYAEGSYGAEMV